MEWKKAFRHRRYAVSPGVTRFHETESLSSSRLVICGTSCALLLRGEITAERQSARSTAEALKEIRVVGNNTVHTHRLQPFNTCFIIHCPRDNFHFLIMAVLNVLVSYV